MKLTKDERQQKIRLLYQQSIKPLTAPLSPPPVPTQRSQQILMEDLTELLNNIDISRPIRTKSTHYLAFFIDQFSYILRKIMRPLTKILLERQIKYNQINSFLLYRVISLENRILSLEKSSEKTLSSSGPYFNK